jgi:hypothetical protein
MLEKTSLTFLIKHNYSKLLLAAQRHQIYYAVFELIVFDFDKLPN